METTKIILRKNLIELRDLKGWNQEDLAEACGYTRGFIADIERGKSWVSPESIEAISGTLGVPIARLFQDKDIHRVIPMPMSRTLKMMMNIPDKIYEYAQDEAIDNETWVIIEDIMEGAIKERKLLESSSFNKA